VAEHLALLRERGLSERTVNLRRMVLGLIAEHIAPTALLEVSPAQLRAWQRSLMLRPGPNGPSDLGLAKSSRHLHGPDPGFYRWAYAEGLITADPSAKLVLPQVDKGKPPPIDELGLSANMVRSQLATWARAGRIVHTDRGAYRLGPSCPTEPPAATAAIVSQTIGGYLREVGIEASAHSLRHRFATGFYRRTKDLATLRALLGHESLATTQIYVEPDEAAAVAAVAGLAPGGAA